MYHDFFFLLLFLLLVDLLFFFPHFFLILLLVLLIVSTLPLCSQSVPDCNWNFLWGSLLFFPFVNLSHNNTQFASSLLLLTCILFLYLLHTIYESSGLVVSFYVIYSLCNFFFPLCTRRGASGVAYHSGPLPVFFWLS